MITESIILGSAYLALNVLRDTRQYKIKRGLHKVLEIDNGYKIIETKKIDTGYKVIISCMYGGYLELEKLKDKIDSTIGYLTELEQNDNYKTATLSVSITPIQDNDRFEIEKVKPHELYLGQTHMGKKLIISMKEYPHMLYTGINNSGKTYCLLTALTNLINQYGERDIEIYLAQTSAKKDLRKFKDCIQCRGFAQDLNESLDLFAYLFHTMQKRINLFNSIKEGYIDDIYSWNKAFPSRRMRIIYLAMDEFNAFMSDKLDNKEDTLIKDKSMDLLVKLIQQCRCTGIYVLTSLQRPDKESLPPRLKCQFNTRVSFKQSNIASSLTACDSDKAFYLKNREAIVNADTEYLMKTLYLDNKMIEGFIKERIDKSNKYYWNKEKKNEKIVVGNDKKDIKYTRQNYNNEIIAIDEKDIKECNNKKKTIRTHKKKCI